MMIQIHQKSIPTAQLQHRLVQGESNIEKVVFFVPNVPNIDFSVLIFTIKLLAEDEGKIVIGELDMDPTENGILLSWDVSKKYTRYGGGTRLQIDGADATGNIVYRALSEKFCMRKELTGEDAVQNPEPDPEAGYVPPIESGDNGKYLRAMNGEAIWDEIDHPKEIFWVELDTSAMKCSHSPAEILEAVNKGLFIMGRNTTTNSRYYCTGVDTTFAAFEGYSSRDEVVYGETCPGILAFRYEVTRGKDLRYKSSYVLSHKKLPNPFPLEFTGAVTGSYDGSEPMKIKIPTGGSGGSAFPNWAENNPAEPGYIRGRTHWAEDPVLVTVLPEMTVTADPESLNAYFTPETPPVVNARYNVQLDGAAYSVTAVELMDLVCLGNTSLAGAENDTGEPFLLLYSLEEQVMIGIFTAAGEHTLSVFGEVRTYHIIDEAYLPPLIGKPGTAAGAEVFNGSFNTALGISSHAEGFTAAASGMAAHAEGDHTTASGDGSHAEGCETNASACYTHAEGYQTAASGNYSHAEGFGASAQADGSHAEGDHTVASGGGSHAEGLGTIARASYQHVEGKYNEVDTTRVYAHIVGNGTNNARRSNAYMLDWSGNGFFSGYVQARNDFRLLSPNGTRYRLYVDDDGTLHTEMTL